MMNLLSLLLCEHSALFFGCIVVVVFFFFEGWAKLHLMSCSTILPPDVDGAAAQWRLFLVFSTFTDKVAKKNKLTKIKSNI